MPAEFLLAAAQQPLPLGQRQRLELRDRQQGGSTLQAQWLDGIVDMKPHWLRRPPEIAAKATQTQRSVATLISGRAIEVHRPVQWIPRRQTCPARLCALICQPAVCAGACRWLQACWKRRLEQASGAVRLAVKNQRHAVPQRRRRKRASCSACTASKLPPEECCTAATGRCCPFTAAAEPMQLLSRSHS